MTALAQLDKRYAELEQQALAIVRQRDIHALESFLAADTDRTRLLEGMLHPGDPILTPYMIQRETGFGAAAIGPHISQADDYYRGRCKPLYENESDLQSIRGCGRWLAAADEMACNVIKNLRNYTVGSGGKATVSAKKNRGGETIAPAVQEFVDDFLEFNDFANQGESDLLISAVRDGEALLWLKPQAANPPKVEFVGGEHITEPDRPEIIEEYYGAPGLDWSFGVATPPCRYEEVVGYFALWYGQYDRHGRQSENWDFIPAAHAVFVKRNVPRAAKRGVSDFYVPFHSMDRASRLAQNIAKGATWQSSIAGIKKLAAGAQQADVEAALRAKLTNTSITLVRPDGQSISATGETVAGGRIINTSSDYMHGPMGTPQGPVFVEVYQMLARLVGSRWVMPEYMVSGDASNANLASTLVAGAPFVHEIKNEQASLGASVEELLWKAIDMEAARNPARFGGMSGRELHRVLAIAVEYPPPENIDAKQQEEIRTLQQNAGILSAKTRAAKSGLDYEEELANGAKEKVEPTPFGGALSPGGFNGSGGRGGVGYAPRLEQLAEQALARLGGGTLVEEARWITLDNGVRVKIDDGETVADAIGQLRADDGDKQPDGEYAADPFEAAKNTPPRKGKQTVRDYLTSLLPPHVQKGLASNESPKRLKKLAMFWGHLNDKQLDRLIAGQAAGNMAD